MNVLLIRKFIFLYSFFLLILCISLISKVLSQDSQETETAKVIEKLEEIEEKIKESINTSSSDSNNIGEAPGAMNIIEKDSENEPETENNKKKNNKNKKSKKNEKSRKQQSKKKEQKKEETQDLDEENFIQEWEERMLDYQQDFIFTTILNPRKPQIYYEEFTVENFNSTIRGAFIVQGEKGENIQLEIIQGEEKLLSVRGGQKIFTFTPLKPGVLAIVLSCKRKTKLTFTMETNRLRIVTKEHMTYSEKKIDSLMNFIKNYDLKKHFLKIKHENRNKSKFLVSFLFYLLLISFKI